MTGRGSSPRYLPLLFVLKRLMNWRVEKRPWEWEQMPGDFGSVSGEQRGCSLFPRLSARLLFWLTSASAWDATSAPATKHTSSSTPHTTALLLLLLLQATAATALGHHLLLDHVDDLVRDAEVLDGAATDVTLGHPPEFVPILRGVGWGVRPVLGWGVDRCCRGTWHYPQSAKFSVLDAIQEGPPPSRISLGPWQPFMPEGGRGGAV